LTASTESRRRGGQKSAERLKWVPKGGISDPVKANAEFVRLLNGRCFCNRVCKCGKRRAVTTVVTDFKQMETRYISPFEYDEYIADGWDINIDLGHHSVHALLATRVIE